MRLNDLEREKMLFRYSSALERGDFATVSAILQTAESDPVLESMLWEINAAYPAESRSSFTTHYQVKKGNRHMNTTTMSAPLRAPVLPLRNMVALAAAVLAVILIGGVFVLLPPESNTAIQSTLIQPPTDPLQTVAQSLCAAAIGAETADLYTRPGRNGVVVGNLAADQAVEVLDADYAWFEIAVDPWYFVSAQVDGSATQGWLVGDKLALSDDCPEQLTPFYVPAGVEGCFLNGDQIPSEDCPPIPIPDMSAIPFPVAPFIEGILEDCIWDSDDDADDDCLGWDEEALEWCYLDGMGMLASECPDGDWGFENLPNPANLENIEALAHAFIEYQAVTARFLNDDATLAEVQTALDNYKAALDDYQAKIEDAAQESDD